MKLKLASPIVAASLACAALLACLGAPRAWAELPVRVSAGAQRVQIRDSEVEAWLDREGRLSATDLVRAERGELQSTDLKYLRFPIWLRFRVQADENASPDWALTLTPPFLESIELYEFDENGALLRQTDFALKKERTGAILPLRHPTFSLHLRPGRSSTLLLRIRSIHHLNLHPQLVAAPTLAADTTIDEMLLGIYCGIFAAIFLINLFMYVATREPSTLFYCLLTLSLWLQITTLTGILDFYGPRGFNFSDHLVAFSALANVAAQQFTRTFLNTRRLAPLCDRIHLGLMGLSGAIAALSLTPLFRLRSDLFGYGIDLAISACILSYVVSAVVTLSRGFRPALIFLLAWTVPLGLLLFYFADQYAVIPATPFAQLGVQFASSLEMILFTLALAYRMHVLQQERAAFLRKAEEGEELRSLMHIICHDLRNTLTVILSRAHLNSESGDPDWVRVKKAARKQNAILDYVHLREAYASGKRKLQLAPVPLHPAVESARFIFEAQLSSKRIALDNQVAPVAADGPWVLADRVALEQTIVNNLVSNAIKFSQPGGRIEISATESGHEIELRVRDEGIGIPESLLKEIFSPTQSTSRPGTQGEQGTGFGMPLVHSVVRTLRGRIRIESRSAQDGHATSGTTVYVHMPRAERPPRCSSAEPILAESPDIFEG